MMRGSSAGSRLSHFLGAAIVCLSVVAFSAGSRAEGDPDALPPLPPKPVLAFDPDVGLVDTSLAVAPAPGSATKSVTPTSGAPSAAKTTVATPMAMSTMAAPSDQVLVRNSRFEYSAVTGLLTKEVIEPGTALEQVTTYGFDAFGNRKTVTSSGAGVTSRTTTVTFDSKGRLATKVTNPLSHQEQTSYSGTEARGLPAMVTGPNGTQSKAQYDVFGRKVLDIAPDGTAAKTEYFYCTGYGTAPQVACPVALARYVVVTTPYAYDLATSTLGAQIGPWSKVYMDALNRQVRVEAQRVAAVGDDGTETVKVATVDLEYDNRGRVVRQSDAYFPGDTVIWTTSEYDVLDRTTRVNGADGSVNRTFYYGLRTRVLREAGGQSLATNSYRNSQGSTIRVKDSAGENTFFDFDPFGSLVRTRAPGGIVTTATFDARGQRTQLNDPDLGVRNYVYDTFGQVTSETDAKGQQTVYTYDKLGRVLTVRECTATCSTATTQLLTTTVYDTAPMGKGKPTSVTTSTGHQQSFTYDSLGRPSGTVESLDGGVSLQTATVTYGAYGRVTSSTTASGQIFAYGYTNLGLTWTIAVGGGCTGGQGGCGTIFRAQTLDADGAVTREIYGNGVVTTRTIDRTRGVVTAIESKKGTTTVQKLSYQYDGFLNMTQRDDQVSRVRENFAFDILNRLTASSAERYDGTPATYASQAVSYDAVGNITAKSDVGLYQYGAANGPRPHAVTAITPAVGGGTVNTSFTYDANGNMLTGHGRTYAWTAFDMPSTITRGPQTLAFTYGIGHQRIRQVKNGGAETIQYYGGGQAERITDATGTRWIDYVSVGGRLIGTQTRAEGAALSAGVAAYYHVDHLGSVDRITNWQGTVVEVQDYDAWGKRRFATGAPDSAGTITSTARRGFTGHEQLDSVGLVHMNGRVYDPFVARFTSADPMLQAPQNLQSHNRYSYALNNPLSYTDPSGFFNIGKFFKKVFKGIGSFLKGLSKFVFSRQGLGLLVGVVLMTVLGPGGALAIGSNFWAGVGAAAISGAAAGAISTGTLKGAIIGAVSAAVTYGIGHGLFPEVTACAPENISGSDPFLERALSHGFAQGAIAEVSGGDFRSGFLSGGFASLTGSTFLNNIPARTFSRAIAEIAIGGTVSAIGGGKFSNGAYSAAYVWAFNAAACQPPANDDDWQWGIDAMMDSGDWTLKAIAVSLIRSNRGAIYVTYTRGGPNPGMPYSVYSGRTSGYADPASLALRRSFNQPLLNLEGFSPPIVDRYSKNYFAIRGREQQLIDYFGGAQSVGGSARNMINGVSDFNPLRPVYISESIREFGLLPDNSPKRFRLGD